MGIHISQNGMISGSIGDFPMDVKSVEKCDAVTQSIRELIENFDPRQGTCYSKEQMKALIYHAYDDNFKRLRKMGVLEISFKERIPFREAEKNYLLLKEKRGEV